MVAAVVEDLLPLRPVPRTYAVASPSRRQRWPSLQKQPEPQEEWPPVQEAGSLVRPQRSSEVCYAAGAQEASRLEPPRRGLRNHVVIALSQINKMVEMKMEQREGVSRRLRAEAEKQACWDKERRMASGRIPRSKVKYRM